MSICGLILKLFGWKVAFDVPVPPKCIFCVAPHTSNWDFILGKLAYSSTGNKAGFLMKEAWFFFPLGVFLRAIGGIPVAKRKGADLTASVIEKYNTSKQLALAITPEGTRKRNKSWRKGCLVIAKGANIPILLAYIDYQKKEIGAKDTFIPTDDIKADIKYLKNYYKDVVALHPENFSTED